MSETDLNFRARDYFIKILDEPDNKITENITNALFLYSVLQNLNPEHTEYSVKLGILYDKISKDRYAKSNYARAIQTNRQNPKPYFYYAEFYYKRENYRKALKYYNEAYKLGFDKNYSTLYKIADIYEKFGDTRSALKYFKEAQLIKENQDLLDKISKLEQNNTQNKEIYKNTRIRIEQ